MNLGTYAIALSIGAGLMMQGAFARTSERTATLGREAQPGDDRGKREAQPGDDRGGKGKPHAIAREAQPGDDRGRHGEKQPGDDRRGRGEREPGDDRGHGRPNA